MHALDVKNHRLLNCVNVPLIKRHCRLQAFVETGILDGDGVVVARHFGFEQIYSCDIDPGAIRRARARVPDAGVELALEDSREFLRRLKTAITVPTLFWLDAHFSDEPPADAADFPLLAELRLLADRPGIDRDVLICDDMRVIPGDDNPTFAGEDHPHFAANPRRFIQYGLTLPMLWEPYRDTHDAYLVNFEMGVLLLLPRGTPYRPPYRRLLRFLKVPTRRIHPRD
jgi:hypothetical protein